MKKIRDIHTHWKDPQAPAFVIGEVAQAHDGSLGLAHAYIDAIATAGADAVKFQTHIADEESSADEPWRVKFSRQDQSRYDYWRRMEFSADQWAGLKQHAEEMGLTFISSPFSVAAADLLERLNMTFWKIASGEVLNVLLLDFILKTKKPVLLSSGMSYFRELDLCVEKVKAGLVPFAVMQCTTAYPCPAEKIGLNLLADYHKRYSCPVGLSDHSGTIFPCLAAATQGAKFLEVHVTMSRDMFGPDVPASVTTAEFAELVRGVRFVEAMLSHPVEKDLAAETFKPLREMFGQSLVAQNNLAAGQVIRVTDLTSRKPGRGIPVSKAGEISGRMIRVPVKKGAFLSWDDLENSTSP